MADSKVKVAVRVRPMNQRETDNKAECVVYMEGLQTVVRFTSPTFDGNCPAQKEFQFDHCFWSVNDEDPAKYASQEDVFTSLGEDILDNTFTGFNSCIFAYGQTGSGKTYSMMGTDDQPGLVPRICSALFSRDVSHLTSLQVEATYLEIYNEKVRDLLYPTSDFKALKVREHKSLGPYVEGLSHHAVRNAEDIKSLILEGNKCRKIGNTKMNEHSSRSHAIFTLTVTQTFQKENTVKELLSKVSLVDLAGSERTSITGATGEQLKESSNINKSLSSLGLVINSLAELSEGKRSSGYVNYRDSVLTWLLKNNLGGNSKTVMLATISPASIHYQETLSTLKYADNAKRIVNKPTVNEDLKSRAINELAKEVKGLREQLRQAEPKHNEELQAKLKESETLLQELEVSWEEKLKMTEISASERQKHLQRLGIMVEYSGIRVDEDKCYLLNLSIDNEQRELLIYYLGESTKIGAGDSQDIKITGPGIELEHCVIDILQDGNVVLTPDNNAETFVNSSRVNTAVMLTHEDKIMLGNKASFMLHKPNTKPKIAQEGASDVVHDVPVHQQERNKQGNESGESSTQKINIPQTRSYVSPETRNNKHLHQDSCDRKNTATETIRSPNDHNDDENFAPNVICKRTNSDEHNAVDKDDGDRTSIRATSQAEIGEHLSEEKQISKDDDESVIFINPTSQIVMEEYLENRNQIPEDSENLNSTDDDKTAVSSNRPSQTEKEQNMSPENQIPEDRTDISMNPTSPTEVEKIPSGEVSTSNDNGDDVSVSEASQDKLEQCLCGENQKPDSDTTEIHMNQTSQMETEQNVSSETQISKDEDDGENIDMSTKSTPRAEMEHNLSGEKDTPSNNDITAIPIDPTPLTEKEQNKSSEDQIPKATTDASINPTSHTNMEINTSCKKQTSNNEGDEINNIFINQTSRHEIGQNTEELNCEDKTMIFKDDGDDDSSNICISPVSQPLELSVGASGITRSENISEKEDTNNRCTRSSVGELPLEKKAANYIQRSREQIMAVLQKDFDKFLDKLDQENIITQEEYFKVENMETDKKARTLVNLMLQKDELTCRAFLQCLRLNPEEENSPEQKVKESPTDESEKGTVVKGERREQDAGSAVGGASSSIISRVKAKFQSWRSYVKSPAPNSEADKSLSDAEEREKLKKNANDGSEEGAKQIFQSWMSFGKSPAPNSAERQPDAGSADGGTSSFGSSRVTDIFGGFWSKSVGIFSRSSESEYSWLQRLLDSPDFSNIKSVHSCYISNNGFCRFCDDVSQCKFGILYHTKKRGRVNVTDVTDSLYDEELEYLSSTLGKKNVVVVIDDLDDTSDTMKYKLLSSQPKIKNLAQDLILVRSASPEEKKRRARDALKKVLN